MAEAAGALELADVDAVERGRAIYRRRDAMGVTARDLAREAGLSRSRIPLIEKGDPSVRESTFLAVEQALEKFERLLGMPAEDEPELEVDPADRWVRATVTGNFNVKAVYEGPPEVVGPLVKDLFAQLHEGQEKPTIDPAVTGPIREAVAKRKTRRGAGEGGPDQPATR